MKAIVLAIVSLTVSAALANPPAAPAAKTTTPAATTTTMDAHAAHGTMADGTKMDDKCAGKTGKEMETCMKEMKKAKK